MATLLKDQLFLSKSDFVDFREVSANITDAKINIFIREAQTVEARGFLGQNLWRLLQDDWNLTDFTTEKYNDLWFGTDYANAAGDAIRFNGYMNSIVYFSYARLLLQNQLNVSRFGAESIQNEISEDVSNAQVRSKARDAQQVAFTYQLDTETFLKDKATIYPEWENATRKPKKTSLPFFKV